jgi:hypothetical protein
MIGLALALIVTAAIKPKPQPAASERTGTTRALATWLAFAACVAVMGVLGFRISFALFTFFLVAFIFGRPLLTAALTAVCAAGVFHLAFPILLGVPLPTGWFGF